MVLNSWVWGGAALTRRLYASSQVHTFEAGAVIYAAGASSDAFNILETGTAVLECSLSHRISVLTRGDFIGQWGASGAEVRRRSV
jgi:CRP-like cAMP-binding protein